MCVLVEAGTGQCWVWCGAVVTGATQMESVCVAYLWLSTSVCSLVWPAPFHRCDYATPVCVLQWQK